jgi:hypothetical protein
VACLPTVLPAVTIVVCTEVFVQLFKFQGFLSLLFKNE